MKLIRTLLDYITKEQIAKLEEELRISKAISEEKSNNINKLKATIKTLESKIQKLESNNTYIAEQLADFRHEGPNYGKAVRYKYSDYDRDLFTMENQYIQELKKEIDFWKDLRNSSQDDVISQANEPKKKRRKTAAPPNLEELISRQLSQDSKGQDLESCTNPNTIFYNKKIVITGVFCQYPDRDELALLLKSYGADMKSSVSSRTNIVIMGSDAGPKKQEKIIELNNNGCDIQVINEFELYKILDDIEKGN
ncbi:MAG: hypothetical protein OSJ55_07530 [Bacteroidales bacterium]|nr:hypothetical protein [Bacteroidales bacterium]